MTALLDTHVLVWAMNRPEKLPEQVQEVLNAGGYFVSVASFWEIVTKAGKGSLKIADPVAWWNHTIRLLGVQALPIRSAHVETLARLPPLHKDPFDRILIAQALAEGVPLATDDWKIREYPVRVVWA